jgi:hypothetical protein
MARVKANCVRGRGDERSAIHCNTRLGHLGRPRNRPYHLRHEKRWEQHAVFWSPDGRHGSRFVACCRQDPSNECDLDSSFTPDVKTVGKIHFFILTQIPPRIPAKTPANMCGVIAVLLADPDAQACQLLYDGLTMLQHRGQDAAGIVTCEPLSRSLHMRKVCGSLAGPPAWIYVPVSHSRLWLTRPRACLSRCSKLAPPQLSERVHWHRFAVGNSGSQRVCHQQANYLWICR